MEEKLKKLKEEFSKAEPGSIKAKLLSIRIKQMEKRIEKGPTKVGKILKTVKEKAVNTVEDVKDAAAIIKAKKEERKKDN